MKEGDARGIWQYKTWQLGMEFWDHLHLPCYGVVREYDGEGSSHAFSLLGCCHVLWFVLLVHYSLSLRLPQLVDASCGVVKRGIDMIPLGVFLLHPAVHLGFLGKFGFALSFRFQRTGNLRSHRCMMASTHCSLSTVPAVFSMAGLETLKKSPCDVYTVHTFESCLYACHWWCLGCHSWGCRTLSESCRDDCGSPGPVSMEGD